MKVESAGELSRDRGQVYHLNRQVKRQTFDVASSTDPLYTN